MPSALVSRVSRLTKGLRKGKGAPPEFLESDRRVRADEYLQWLCTVVGGWLTPDHGNLRAFDYAVRHMPDGGAIVEIGAFLGLSTNAIAYLALTSHRNNPFFTCDPWQFEGTERPIGGYFDASRDAYRRYAKEVFKLNVGLFSEQRLPFALEMTSAQFFALWSQGATSQEVFGRQVALGGPISFAYIDGAHAYEAVKGDLEAVDQHLLPGGLLLLDDSADSSTFSDVTRAAHELLRNPTYELVHKTPNYFVRKVRCDGASRQVGG